MTTPIATSPGSTPSESLCGSPSLRVPSEPPGAGLTLEELATLGMQEIVASLQNGRVPIRASWVAVQGAARYRHLVAKGYKASKAEAARRAAICAACPSRHTTRGELGVRGVGTVPLIKGWCGHPLMPNLRPLRPEERTCGCLVTLSIEGTGHQAPGTSEEEDTLSVELRSTSLPGGESEGRQGPRTVYAAGKTSVDEAAAQRDGVLGKGAEVGCPQGKW